MFRKTSVRKSELKKESYGMSPSAHQLFTNTQHHTVYSKSHAPLRRVSVSTATILDWVKLGWCQDTPKCVGAVSNVIYNKC